MTNCTTQLYWNDNGFKIGNHQFQIITKLHDLYLLKDEDGFVLGKTRRYIEKYLQHLNQSYSNILELGIFRGGSTVFLNEYFRPEKLVAIDIAKKPAPALQNYVESFGHHGRVVPHNSVDQSDAQRLQQILRDDFQGQPLDLIIDDASHFLDLSRASFNTLFPHLREGGVYVIEDWNWAHQLDDVDVIQENFSGRTPLSNLVIEILIASASAPGIIDEVTAHNGFAIIRRGPDACPDNFDVGDLPHLMGQRMGRIAPFPA